MEIHGVVHLFFEQSGVFKNEFKKLGYEAYDYDIQNNFGETDYQIDLFAEIEKAYRGGVSIFDKISSDGLIMAFFPCIYFCENNELYFTGKHFNLRKHSQIEIDNIIIRRAEERNRLYTLLLKLFNVCNVKNLRLIVENPYSTQHYLFRNFPYQPIVIDKDRTKRGDFFKKPTQYFFHNCKNTIGYSFQKPVEKRTVHNSKSAVRQGLCSEERSMISPDYARNFICDFIIGKEQKHTMRSLFN